jgi:hypothetical protein
VTYVPPRSSTLVEPVCWFALGPSDRALVEAGARVEVGDPLLERAHEIGLVHVPAAAATALEPGQRLDPLSLIALGRQRRRLRPNDRATVLYKGADGRAHLAIGRSPETVVSVVAGVVRSVDASGIAVHAEGNGIPAAVAWGRPVRGPLLIAVSAPDAELRASAIDVATAGSVIVAGARVDIEVLTRARALGARGIICGGLVGKELRQLEASEARQRASLHPIAPFGLVLLDGYGRRPIPGPWWDALTAGAGREVAIVPDPPLVVLDGGGARPAAPARVRVVAGDDLGREGRLLDLRGLVKVAGGVAYLPSGLVALHGRTPSDPPERRVVPLTDLERFD